MKHHKESKPSKESEEVILLKKIREAEDSSTKLIANAQKKAADLVDEANKRTAERLATAAEQVENDRKKAMENVKALALKGGNKIIEDEKSKITRLRRPKNDELLEMLSKTISEEFDL